MVLGELAQETEVLVIGSGPDGYAAAFRAADLDREVTMVDLREISDCRCANRLITNGSSPSLRGLGFSRRSTSDIE